VVHPVNLYRAHLPFGQVQRPGFTRRDTYQTCCRVAGKTIPTYQMDH